MAWYYSAKSVKRIRREKVDRVKRHLDVFTFNFQWIKEHVLYIKTEKKLCFFTEKKSPFIIRDS